jgi:hypothetical protein
VGRSILRDEPLPFPAEEAVAALRVALAAVESAQTGLPVDLVRRVASSART